MNTKSPLFLMACFVVIGIMVTVGSQWAAVGSVNALTDFAEEMEDPEKAEQYREDLLKDLEERRRQAEERERQAAAEAAKPEPKGNNVIALVATGFGGLLLVGMMGVLVVLGQGGEEDELPPLPSAAGEGLEDAPQGGPDGRKPAPKDQEA